MAFMDAVNYISGTVQVKLSILRALIVRVGHTINIIGL